MVARVGILMHRRERISAQRAPGARKTSVVRPRRSRMRVSRRRIEMMLIRRPERSIPMLLEFDEGALRHRSRIPGIVRRRRPDMPLARHRRRTRRILVGPPERGTQIGEVQRRKWFVIHLDGVW